MTREMGLALLLIVAGAAAILLLAFAFKALQTYKSFSRELRHLKTEIRRSHGKQRKEWKRQKRVLWFSWLTLHY